MLHFQNIFVIFLSIEIGWKSLFLIIKFMFLFKCIRQALKP